MFFLISGWLVGGSLLNRLAEPKIFVSYAIDRITRMWLVLIPAFGLTLLLAELREEVDLRQFHVSPDNEYSPLSFIGNLFGLQDMVVLRFGDNFSLWSLANEIWYYILFPLLVVVFMARANSVKWAAAAALIVAACSLPDRVVLYFAIWLLGVGFSRIRIEGSRSARLSLLAVLLTASVYFRLAGSNDLLEPESFSQDLLFSILFLAFLSSQQHPADNQRIGTRIARAVGPTLAAFSFTLYVIHVPLLRWLRGITTQSPMHACRPTSRRIWASMR